MTTRMLLVWVALGAWHGIAPAQSPPGAAPSPVAPPASAFSVLPQVRLAALSPSGRYLSWADGSASPTVVVYDLESANVVRRVALDDKLKLRATMWADDDTVILEVSVLHGSARFSGRHEFFRYLAIDRTTGNTRLLLTDAGRSWMIGVVRLGWLAAKPGTMLVSMPDFDPKVARETMGADNYRRSRDGGVVESVFAVDTHTGVTTRAEPGTPYTADWALDAAGRVIARGDLQLEAQAADPGQPPEPAAPQPAGTDDAKADGDEADKAPLRYTLYQRTAGGWREFARLRHFMSLLAPTADGKALLAIGDPAGKHDRLWELPFDGSPPRVVAEDPKYEVKGAYSDRYDGTVLGVHFDGPEQRVQWIDARMAKRAQSLGKAFGGGDVVITSRSADGKRVLAIAQGPSNPPRYFLVDYNTGRADLVGEAYPALADQPLGKTHVISYAARDGTEIPAYLTLPPATPGPVAAPGPTAPSNKALPLVVLVHGGPEARDTLDFDWWAQFMATRGYAVLQPQFRGSTGFGEAHRKAGVRQWGRRMQDDVTDGVKAMIARGIADPQRVCIAGASYGGYAALAGAALTPDLYRCAVSVAGVSDLPIMIGDIVRREGGLESRALDYWREHIGLPSSPDVVAASPARIAENIRIPVLLLHGDQDTVVPISQSERMEKALKRLRRPYRYVVMPGETHFLERAASRQLMLEEIERFLATHLQPAAP
jgi:dipeptidyl aminopeptidase/acylaminoacyl peptidase